MAELSLQRIRWASNTTIRRLAVTLGTVHVVHWLGKNTEASLGPGYPSMLRVAIIRAEELTLQERRVFVKLLFDLRALITCSNLRLSSEFAEKVYLRYYRHRADILHLQRALSAGYDAVIQQIGAVEAGSGPGDMQELIPCSWLCELEQCISWLTSIASCTLLCVQPPSTGRSISATF